MLPLGANSTSSVTTFTRSKIQLDPADYDGATYYFEVIGANNSGSDNTIELMDANGGTVTSLVLQNTDTAVTRRRSTAFTPAAGANPYRVKIASAALNQVLLYAARIIVVQVNATKTAVQIPLVASYNNTGAGIDYSVAAGQTVTTTSETYVQGGDSFALWRKNASSWGAIAGYRFEALIGGNSATCLAALWDATANAVIPGSELGENGLAPAVHSVELNAWDLPNDHDFELRFRRDPGGTGSAHMYSGNLYVKLTNLTKAETYLRVSKRFDVSSSQTAPYARQLLELNSYSAADVFVEATGAESAAGTVSVNLRDDGTNDSGTGGTNVGGSTIEFSSATRQRVRTATIAASVANGKRYTMRVERTSGSVIGAAVFLVVAANAALGPDVTTPTTPANASQSNVTAWSAQINWAASTDTGGSGLAGYKIYRGGVLLKTVNAGTTTFIDHSLRPQTGYTYTVVAFDNAGNQSQPSAGVVVTTPTATGLNVVVPIEMLSLGFGSGSSATTLNRSAVQLDPADYDGASYYFEVIGSNSSGSDKTVELVSASGTTISSAVLLASDTGVARRRGSSFTPATGANTYRVKVPAASSNQVVIYNARIMIVQVNATKTAIQIPLIASRNTDSVAVDFSSLVGGTDSTQSQTLTQSNSDAYNLWLKNAASWATVSGYRFEAIMSAYFTPTEAALFDVDAGSAISGSQLSYDQNTPTLKSVALTESSLPDGHKFELRIRRTGTTGSAYVMTGNLYVKLTNLSKAETYLRFSKQFDYSSTGTYEHARQLLELDSYSAPDVFVETTGRESTSGTVSLNVREDGTNDVGTLGSNVTGGSIEFSSATKERVRTATILSNVSDGKRYTLRVIRASGTVKGGAVFIVIGVNQ